MPDSSDANRKLLTNPSFGQQMLMSGVAERLEGRPRSSWEELEQKVRNQEFDDNTGLLYERVANRKREIEDQKWLERRDRLEPANNDSFSEITRKDPYDDDDDNDNDNDDDDDDYEMSEDLTGAKELIKKFERPTTFTKEEENAQNFLDNYKINLLS